MIQAGYANQPMKMRTHKHMRPIYTDTCPLAGSCLFRRLSLALAEPKRSVTPLAPVRVRIAMLALPKARH